MPKSHPLSSSFNTGELTPRLAARLDFTKYASGVETLENFLPLPEGGIQRRAGTRYVATSKNGATEKCRLKRFEFSTTQPYILEFGKEYMRFYKNQGQIIVAETDAIIQNGAFDSSAGGGWTNQSTGSTATISFDDTGNHLDLDGVNNDNAIAEQQVFTSDTNQEHVIRFRVLGAAGDYLTFRVGTATDLNDTYSDFDAYVGYHTIAFTPTTSPFFVQFDNELGKTVGLDDVQLIDDAPVELTTPYAEGDLFEVEGPQSADILYLFHNSYPTYKLERRGDSTWSFVEVDWKDGPYLDINVTSTTMAPAATNGLGIVVTASSTDGINGNVGFKSTDVGRLLRIDNVATGENWGYSKIVEFLTTTTVKVDIRRNFQRTNADVRWRLGSFSGTTGYPGNGSFFQGRLYMGNTTDQPTTFWASNSNFFEDMYPDSDPDNEPDINYDGTIEDDDSLNSTLAADNVNAIQWMSAGEDALAMGTAGGEWIPSSEGIVLTPSDNTAKRQTTHGSAKIQPARVDRVVLFAQRAKRKILEFGLEAVSLKYEAFDMTRLAQHITNPKVIEMAYAEEPDSVLWTVRSDGELLSMTFRRQEDVVGWSRHILGGNFNQGIAQVESVESIPGNDGNGQVQNSEDRDEVWVVVKRTINCNTVRYIEFIERDFETGDDNDDSYYVDSCITYDSTAATSLTGLDHLEGETVTILADGAIAGTKEVSSGNITLDDSASTVQIGLGYTHKLKTLKLASGNPAGTPVGRIKRVLGVTLVVLNSQTFKLGPSSADLIPYDFRTISDPMDAFAPLYTGEFFVEFDGDWALDERMFLESGDPTPFTLLALAPEINVVPGL